MSIIVKHILNSAIEDDCHWNLLYYPKADNPSELDYDIINLPFNFYIPTQNALLSHPNVFDATYILSKFQCINLDGVILSNPIQQFDKAYELSSQLHVPLFCIFNEDCNIKKEVAFTEIEKIQRTAISICFSREVAKSWFLSDYDLLNNIFEITEVIKQCRVYTRK